MIGALVSTYEGLNTIDYCVDLTIISRPPGHLQNPLDLTWKQPFAVNERSQRLFDHLSFSTKMLHLYRVCQI